MTAPARWCIREPDDHCNDCSPNCPACDPFVREELLRAEAEEGKENEAKEVSR